MKTVYNLMIQSQLNAQVKYASAAAECWMYKYNQTWDIMSDKTRDKTVAQQRATFTFFYYSFHLKLLLMSFAWSVDTQRTH